MKKLTNMLCCLAAALLLAGCYEVDEFSGIVTEEVVLDEVVNVADLPYEELAALDLGDPYLLSEMRRMGGLLVRWSPDVASLPFQDAGYGTSLYYSDDRSGLPSDEGIQYYSPLTGYEWPRYTVGGYNYVYLSWPSSSEELASLPGATLYFQALLHSYRGDWPGFVDDVLEGGDVSYPAVVGGGYVQSGDKLSEVQTYTFPNEPVVTDFGTSDVGSGLLEGDFSVVLSPSMDPSVPYRMGICFGTTHSLPDVDHDSVVSVENEDMFNNHYIVYAQVPNGVYYVRAFLKGASEVVYSPVQQVSITSAPGTR